jgi:hypothetical protein
VTGRSAEAAGVTIWIGEVAAKSCWPRFNGLDWQYYEQMQRHTANPEVKGAVPNGEYSAHGANTAHFDGYHRSVGRCVVAAVKSRLGA